VETPDRYPGRGQGCFIELWCYVMMMMMIFKPLIYYLLSYAEQKQSHNTPMGAQGERVYSSCSFTTSALDGGEWSASGPGRALPPGKGPPVPIVQEGRWAPEPVWTQRLEEKILCFCRGSNPDRPVVQSVARHYTDWATPVVTPTWASQNIDISDINFSLTWRLSRCYVNSSVFR
jgi:hypothetical protein